MMHHYCRNLPLCRYRPVVLFIFLLLAGCIPNDAPPSPMGKPTNPLQLTLQPLGTVTMGETAAFEAVVTTAAAFPQVAVEISLPPGIEPISGALQWQGAVQPGTPHRITFTLQLPSTGRYRLHAVARTPGGLSAEALLHISDTEEALTTGIDRAERTAPPTENGRSVREYELR